MTFLRIAASACVFSLVTACSSSSSPTNACTSTADCRAGYACVDGTCRIDTPMDAGSADAPLGEAATPMDASDARMPECSSSTECGDGVCVGGVCCPSMDRVCNGTCCGADQTCFAGACVTPGEICRTKDDCAEGEYCEPGLEGTRDGGAPSVDAGHVCVDPPTAGRCVALPPRCEPGVDAGTCLTECEYRPAVGMLRAVPQWTWGPDAIEFPEDIDVWSTPAVARITDTNCDGVVDALDPPNVVFISAFVNNTCCQCDGTTPQRCRRGVLRVLDGRTGTEVWSLDKPSPTSSGFSGVSVALGDVDRDGEVDIVATTGEGYIVVVDRTGRVKMTSDVPIPGAENGSYGWGGGLALADMEGDGDVEVAFSKTVWTITGGEIRHRFTGAGTASGGGTPRALSTFVDLDADPDLELVIGKAAFDPDGTVLWRTSGVPDGFPGIGDFDGDGAPEVVVVGRTAADAELELAGQITILEGATGEIELGPTRLPGTGQGGPPTVADFDGDGVPEIGVALQNYYVVLEADYEHDEIDELWRAQNHDLSSSVTGSTVFDFEGDGASEVVYNDECYLWVFDGRTGDVRFAGLTTSFTGTEASVVADVDGDGHAEMLMIANGVATGASGWECNVAPWTSPDPETGRPAWVPPSYGPAYRGLTLWKDESDSWVGTRPLWNQHTYHVTNVCDPADTACEPAAGHGAIPARERDNWRVEWLNNFRQNVQQSGLFDAPDPTVTLEVRCTEPLQLVATVRNVGAAMLPEGVEVEFVEVTATGETRVATASTDTMLLPGQARAVTATLPAGSDPRKSYRARIVVDPVTPLFRECNPDNNASATASAGCIE